MNSKQAATYLNITDKVLIQSRYTGFLRGLTTPPYEKNGRSIRYDKSDLDDFSDRLYEHLQTKTTKRAPTYIVWNTDAWTGFATKKYDIAVAAQNGDVASCFGEPMAETFAQTYGGNQITNVEIKKCI